MAVISTEGCFVSVNKSFCRMLGYARSELESRSYFEITHPDDENEVQKSFRQMLSLRIAETDRNRHRYVTKQAIPSGAMQPRFSCGILNLAPCTSCLHLGD